MGRWVAICVLVGLSVLGLARFGMAPERESWQVIVGQSDGSIGMIRFTVSNTGVFANEETTRVAIVRDDNFPLEHRAVGGTAALGDDGVLGAPDTLSLANGQWSWSLGGDAMRSAGKVDGQEGPCPGKVGFSSGFLDVPNFTAQAAEGGLVQGPAMVFRTVEPAQRPGVALYAMSSGGALYLDPAGRCPAWIEVGGARWEGDVAPVEGKSSSFDVAFGPHVAAIRVGDRFVRQGPENTTLLGERALAWLAGYPLPTVTIRSIAVRVDGADARWSGVMVERSDSPQR